MFKPFTLIAAMTALASGLQANTPTTIQQPAAVESKGTASKARSSFKPFTGKINGNHVRMRTAADLDSYIVAELAKDDYIIVSEEKSDFYAVEPPSNLKAYIFRGFVIDNVVEGDRVNVRLAPERDAPIIAHYSTGTQINGKICEENNKWLEISAPSETRFYVAKEYIEYVGKPELKAIHDKRKNAVQELFETTNILTQTELRKPFNEIDAERIAHNYKTIINDYADFTAYVNQATKSLAQFQEDYLHRKIAFLEAKTSKMGNGQTRDEIYEVSNRSDEYVSATDRMKIWEPLEEALYLSWSSMHHAKTMDDFYQDQKLKAQSISGILEPYIDPVKNKPGDYIIKQKDVPFGYVYSTHVNLEDYVGKRVSLVVTPRANNNFAFKAWYVLEVE